MQLDGIHHITAITGDAKTNVDFYTKVLALKMVKKTVNHDMPEVYHLYYADDVGTPGSVLTFFEFPSAESGTAGAGMIHTIVLRVESERAVGFWADRLESHGVLIATSPSGISFHDPEGLGFEIHSQPHHVQLRAHHPEIPPDCALGGFSGVRAYAADPSAATQFLADLRFTKETDNKFRTASSTFEVESSTEHGVAKNGLEGAGTVHHVAWACEKNDQAVWRARAATAGANVTPIIDRIYFQSIYFREPGGVLFEIATKGPGFDVDEPIDHLGEKLVLPERHEHLRETLEQTLTPI